MNFHSSAFGGTHQETPKNSWQRARRVEIQYAARLRKIAEHIGHLVNEFDPYSGTDMFYARRALEQYAQVLDPWARAVAERMITEVAARDKQTWAVASAQMGRALHREIMTAPTGEVMRQLMQEQVTLIKSLPLEAAQRVHNLTLEGMENATRAKEIAKQIRASGEVSESRAMLISRTEVGRTATSLTQARAQHIGSVGYTWSSVGDSDVRPLHKKLNNTFQRWDSPPVADERTGTRAHPGCIWNCRCIPLPVLPN